MPSQYNISDTITTHAKENYQESKEKKPVTFAFIDSQNLNLGMQSLGKYKKAD